MIKQNTPEWLELRKSHIGASDAPVILGESKWKTPLQLWEEKVGLIPTPVMNDAMKRGHELEPIALSAYNDFTGLHAEPRVVFHKEKSWMMASLDGLSRDESMIVEIKCPGIKDHELAAQGTVPKHYYAQLQHQLATIGLDLVHYFSYKDESFHLVEVPRDESFIEKMYASEEAFWNMVQDFESPPLTERDLEEHSDDQAWMEVANELASIQKIKTREKELKSKLMALSGGRSCKGSKFTFKKSTAKGSVQYGKIPELKDVNLDKYRGAPIEKWRFSFS